jgi:hypothetical protein
MKKRTKKPVKPIVNRQTVLHEAAHAVTKARNVSYGEPLDDFGCTAELWDSYIARISQVRGNPDIRPHDISAMMILLKISRLAQSPNEADHWIDIAGYSAIGAECADQTECCN